MRLDFYVSKQRKNCSGCRLLLILISKILVTPVFVSKYLDAIKAILTPEKKVATRSRTVWLHTKVLTVFLVACLYARRKISIARLAMKAKKHMKIRKTSTIVLPSHELGDVMTSSEVVPWDRSYVYVVSSREASAISVVMVEKNRSN